MAKKQKRSVSTPRPVVTEAPTPAAARPAVSSTPRPVTTFASTRSSYSAEFNPDYSIVIKDLKRIGLMAGSFTVLLVVLSFFLR
jgi:hypothetical protein